MTGEISVVTFRGKPGKGRKENICPDRPDIALCSRTDRASDVPALPVLGLVAGLVVLLEVELVRPLGSGEHLGAVNGLWRS